MLLDVTGLALARQQAVADGTQLLFIAKGLECAGDHVTDIAEEVYLMVTGRPLQGPRPASRVGQFITLSMKYHSAVIFDNYRESSFS